MHAAGAKRGKNRASEARLVLVLLLIGWESGTNFGNQSQSAVKQNQSKREITFDTQLKTHFGVFYEQKQLFTVQKCENVKKGYVGIQNTSKIR